MAVQKSKEELMSKKKEEIMKMYKRLDGKTLNSKQVDHLLKEYEEARKRELEFDPRQHRLKHGIRDQQTNGINAFGGQGVKLG